MRPILGNAMPVVARRTFPRLFRRLLFFAFGCVVFALAASAVGVMLFRPPPPPELVAMLVVPLQRSLDDVPRLRDELFDLGESADIDVTIYDAKQDVVASSVAAALEFEEPRALDTFPGPRRHEPDGELADDQRILEPPRQIAIAERANPHPIAPDDLRDGHPRRVIGFGMAPPPGRARIRIPFLSPAMTPSQFSVALTSPSGGAYVAVVRHRGTHPAAVLGMTLGGLVVLLVVGAMLFSLTFASPLGELGRAADAFGAGDVGARADARRAGPFGELARVFNTMAERVTVSLRAERALLANVSHELRTPLARIRVALDLAAEGNVDNVHARLAQIEGDLRELDTILGDVLTAARLDQSVAGPGGLPQLRLAAVDAADLLREVGERFRATQPDHPLEMDVDPHLPVVIIDRPLLRRALDNLLDNAAKYSPPGVRVHLRASADEAVLTLRVQDHGIGIPDQNLPHLFTPFFRGKQSHGREHGGVGLGLALSKRIIEAHRGSLTVATVVDEGTSVIVSLPLGDDEPRISAAS